MKSSQRYLLKYGKTMLTIKYLFQTKSHMDSNFENIEQ